LSLPIHSPARPSSAATASTSAGGGSWRRLA
jgi:hypothetical protein